MTDERPIQPARKGGGVLSILLWVGLGLAVYVLSTGPVVRYCRKQGRQGLPSSVRIFYTPLILLSDNVPPVEKFLDWYVKLWERDR